MNNGHKFRSELYCICLSLIKDENFTLSNSGLVIWSYHIRHIYTWFWIWL